LEVIAGVATGLNNQQPRYGRNLVRTCDRPQHL